MKFFKKNKWLLIILTIIFIGFITISGISPLSLVSSDATILSISDVKVVSKSPELNYEKAFLINLVVNKGGETLIGELKPDDFKNVGSSAIPKSEFTIKLKLEDMRYKYKVIDDNRVLSKVYESTATSDVRSALPTSLVDLSTTKKNAIGQYKDVNNLAPSPATFGSPPPGGDVNAMIDGGEWSYWMPESSNVCFGGCDGNWWTTHMGFVPYYRGYLIDTQAHIEYKVRVELTRKSDGQTFSTIIDNSNTVGSIGDIGRVKWVGGLIASSFPPVPAVKYGVVKGLAGTPNVDKFKFVDNLDYNNYVMTYKNLVNLNNDNYVYTLVVVPSAPPVRVDPDVSGTVLVKAQNDLNNALGFMYAYSGSPNDCMLVDGGLTVSCTSESDIVYPQLQLLIKAEWIGLEIQAGQPVIEEIGAIKTIEEGVSVPLNIKVKNSADVSDAFDLCLNTKPFDVTLGCKRFTLLAGESKTDTITISGVEGSYIGNVTLSSVNNPFSRTSKPIAFKIIKKALPDDISGDTLTKYDELLKGLIVSQTLQGYMIIGIIGIISMVFIISRIRKK